MAVSGINYKDALAALGAAPILRHLPMIPGIDGAGRDASGRLYVLAGRGSGEDWHGSWASQQVVKAELIELPASWSATAAMAIGTAGLTAALGLTRLRQVLGPDFGTGDSSNNGIGSIGKSRPIAVTGATGGVGLWTLRLASGWPADGRHHWQTDDATRRLLHDAGARKSLTPRVLGARRQAPGKRTICRRN